MHASLRINLPFFPASEPLPWQISAVDTSTSSTATKWALPVAVAVAAVAFLALRAAKSRGV